MRTRTFLICLAGLLGGWLEYFMCKCCADIGVAFIIKIIKLLDKNMVMTEAGWANKLFSPELPLAQASRV